MVIKNSRSVFIIMVSIFQVLFKTSSCNYIQICLQYFPLLIVNSGNVGPSSNIFLLISTNSETATQIFLNHKNTKKYSQCIWKSTFLLLTGFDCSTHQSLKTLQKNYRFCLLIGKSYLEHKLFLLLLKYSS